MFLFLGVFICCLGSAWKSKFGNILIALLILFLDIETPVDVLLTQLYMHDKATEFDDMLKSQMESMPSMQLFIHPCMWVQIRFKSIHPASTLSPLDWELAQKVTTEDVHPNVTRLLGSVEGVLQRLFQSCSLHVSRYDCEKLLTIESSHLIHGVA